MSEKPLRLFIALGLERTARREVVRLQERMWGEEGKGLTRPENLHLTLAFLGETAPDRLEDVCWAMEKIRTEPPELVFDRVGVFSGEIWWLGMKENRGLKEIQYRLTDNLIYKGFKLEDRDFVPHLTLARRSKPKKMPKGGYLERPIRSHVRSISLMKSEQIEGKRVYTQLYSVP